MNKWLANLGFQIFTLLSIVSVVFFLFSTSFPDPSTELIGQNTDKETQQAIVNELGLDKPLYKQYLYYINDLSPISIQKEASPNTLSLFAWNNNNIVLKLPYLRRSFQSRELVSSILLEGFKNTAILALCSILIASIVGILFGIISGLNPGNWFSKIIVILSMIGISAPSFFVAIIFSWFFGYLISDLTHLPMVGNIYETNLSGDNVLAIKNIILPSLVLGIRPLSIITQLMRNSILEEKDKDYITLAKSKGLNARNIIKNHLLPNAINPVLTSISGWFASLLAGAFFVEFVFNWRGLGLITIEALEKSDLPVLIGSILLTSTLFIVINSFLQNIYRVIDPRIEP